MGYYKHITEEQAARLIPSVLDREEVYIRANSIVGRTLSNRFIGIYLDSDESWIVGVSDSMISSENFWKEVFGVWEKKFFSYSSEENHWVGGDLPEDYQVLLDRDFPNGELPTRSELEALYIEACQTLKVSPINFDKEVGDWLLKLDSIRGLFEPYELEMAVREEIFLPCGSLNGAIERLAKIKAATLANEWKELCDVRPRRPAARHQVADTLQPKKKAAPRKPPIR